MEVTYVCFEDRDVPNPKIITPGALYRNAYRQYTMGDKK